MARQEPDRLQHAWQAHTAVQNWTNQAETKGTFLLTIESALLAFFTNRVGSGEVFKNLEDDGVVAAGSLAGIGLVLMLRGVIFLVLVVYPRLRTKELEQEKWRNAIYFGHLAGQDPKAIENTLRRRDPLEQLAKQLRHMSDIALYKHQLLQQSMISAGAGFLLIMAGFVMVSFIEQ
jgi:hypothetical protein